MTEEQLREALRELVKAVRDYSAALRSARITSGTPAANLREAANEVAIRLAEADAALSGKREGAATGWVLMHSEAELRRMAAHGECIGEHPGTEICLGSCSLAAANDMAAAPEARDGKPEGEHG